MTAQAPLPNQSITLTAGQHYPRHEMARKIRALNNGLACTDSEHRERLDYIILHPDDANLRTKPPLRLDAEHHSNHSPVLYDGLLFDGADLEGCPFYGGVTYQTQMMWVCLTTQQEGGDIAHEVVTTDVDIVVTGDTIRSLSIYDQYAHHRHPHDHEDMNTRLTALEGRCAALESAV